MIKSFPFNAIYDSNGVPDRAYLAEDFARYFAKFIGTDVYKRQAIVKVFNDLFGEGTDKKIFGNKVNLLTCLQAFDELITQTNTSRAEVEKIANKYSPNRAARRKKK